MTHDLYLRPYAHARHLIHTADLLLFRASHHLSSQSIAIAGRSIYCHAAMAGWWEQRLMALETREWYGGRAIALSNYVAKLPGVIDVFRADLTTGERRAALDAMKDVTGKAYGWGTIWWHSIRMLPVARWFFTPPTDDVANGNLPVCSSAVANAYREGADADPVPELSDRATMPGDLARSLMFDYRFTLTLPVTCEATREAA